MLGVSKITLRPNDLPEEFAALNKAVIVTVYYSQRIPIKFSKGKRCIGGVQERPSMSF